MQCGAVCLDLKRSFRSNKVAEDAGWFFERHAGRKASSLPKKRLPQWLHHLEDSYLVILPRKPLFQLCEPFICGEGETKHNKMEH